ncbi:MAG TPA: tetratricopeptide repeat protein [Casimicrobiaceae bacterium]|nr:tetratricopeptide repeat protein [Casimicrobiaceae bacterium]
MEAHRKGQLAQARAWYKDILRVHPKHAGVLQLLGIVEGQTGHFERAIELIDRAIAVDPDNAEYHSNRGVALKELGRLEAAVASYDTALTLDPERIGDHFNRAVALQGLGQLEAAVESYDKTIELKHDFAEAYANRGVALEELGQLDLALASYDKAIELNPGYPEFHSSRGIALRKLGHLEAAIASFDVAIVLKPRYPEAHSNRGNALQALKRLDEAVASYDRAIALKPDYAEAYSNRGVALQELGRLEAAIASYDRAIELRPDDAEAYSNRGTALEELKQLDAAVASYDRAIALRADYAAAYSNRGIALKQLGQLDAAMASYDRAVALKPDYAEAYLNRGDALMALRQPEAALASFDEAIALRPEYAEAYSNRGIALHHLRQLDAAVASYDKAIALNPDYAEAHSNRGIALQELGQLDAAVASCDRAIALKPDYADAYANRGGALADLKRLDAAAASYAKALELKPGYAFLRVALLHARMQMCDWRNFDEASRALQAQVSSASSFPLLSLFDSPALHRRAAESWVTEKYPTNPALGPIAKIARADKIRIGYFSADFGEHPVSYLLAGVFEAHDRSRFEITGFSFGAGEPDAMTARVAAAMDEFIDVRRQSDRDVAKLARQLPIDIAVDLGGFTHGSRPGIFALRAAPIQASYLGYLGTMGAMWMDYLLADEVIVPAGSRAHYAEKIAYLPSYQANDRTRAISEREIGREEFGLAAKEFVFCSFNAAYKITPATFASWMRILERVEGSVLFLLADNPQATANLRREAVERGVDADRLVFGGRLPLAAYMARYRLADLFLDTLPYNAGTTASDALWSGLPVLTRIGESFPARVAASVLTAIGLPELITTSADEYERVAVELATYPGRLAALRQKVADNRLSTPLFDTARFTRSIEAVYEAMHARHQVDLAPDHILVR